MSDTKFIYLALGIALIVIALVILIAGVIMIRREWRRFRPRKNPINTMIDLQHRIHDRIDELILQRKQDDTGTPFETTAVMDQLRLIFNSMDTTYGLPATKSEAIMRYINLANAVPGVSRFGQITYNKVMDTIEFKRHYTPVVED